MSNDGFKFTGLRDPNNNMTRKNDPYKLIEQSKPGLNYSQGAPAEMPDTSNLGKNIGSRTNMTEGMQYKSNIEAPSMTEGAVKGAVTGGIMSGGNPAAAAAIGAGAGMLQAGLGAAAAKKQQERQLRAQALQQQSRIEQSRGQEKNVALSNIMSALRSAMIGG